MSDGFFTEDNLYDWYARLGAELGAAVRERTAEILSFEPLHCMNHHFAMEDIEEGDVGDVVPLPPLSPCCNAPTFVLGDRRVCDTCRLTKPL